jgi:transposase-like protein
MAKKEIALAMGIRVDGYRDVLGTWAGRREVKVPGSG